MAIHLIEHRHGFHAVTRREITAYLAFLVSSEVRKGAGFVSHVAERRHQGAQGLWGSRAKWPARCKSPDSPPRLPCQSHTIYCLPHHPIYFALLAVTLACFLQVGRPKRGRSDTAHRTVNGSCGNKKERKKKR